MKAGFGVKVSVTSDFDMFDNDGSGSTALAYSLYNSVPTLINSGDAFATFKTNGTEEGSIEVNTASILAAGSYKGTMDFTIEYVVD